MFLTTETEVAGTVTDLSPLTSGGFPVFPTHNQGELLLRFSSARQSVAWTAHTYFKPAQGQPPSACAGDLIGL